MRSVLFCYIVPDTDGDWHGTTLSMLELGLRDLLKLDIGVVTQPIIYSLL